MMDNPLGFCDALMATCNASDEAHRGIFGYLPLYIEAGLNLAAGQQVEVDTKSGAQTGVVTADHGNGLFTLTLDDGTVMKSQPGFQLRPITVDNNRECALCNTISTGDGSGT